MVNNPYTNPLEENEQLALVEWLRLHNIAFAHVPNEGMHKVQYRKKQKALGVQAGMPDLLIFDHPPANPDKIGVAIELKRRKGGQISARQKRWLKILSDRGWVAMVCNGAGEAIDALDVLGYGRRRRG